MSGVNLYRRNVGLMLIAPDRRIFVGRRAQQPNGQPDAWQMPQGGVDDGETPVEAACRELWEEVGTSQALLLRESAKWLTYDVPEKARPAHWKGRWVGQAQRLVTVVDREQHARAAHEQPGVEREPHDPQLGEHGERRGVE